MEDNVNRRYAQMGKGLSEAHPITAAASILCIFTVANTIGRWDDFAIVVGVTLLGGTVNFIYLRRYLETARERTELLRTIFNALSTVVITHFSHWPLSQWLMLPLMVLVVDPFGGRVAVWNAVVLCGVTDVAALVSGQPWAYPAGFTVMVWFCYEISKARFVLIRDMLSESERHRLEQTTVNAKLERAHTELTEEMVIRERMENELRQAQKLEAVGRLAAGVAHEINTPVQFVNDSVHFVRDAVADTIPLLRKYQAFRTAFVAGGADQSAADELTVLEEEVDLEYLCEHMPAALGRSMDGLKRITTIVRSLKEFAHPDQAEMSSVDINQAVASTLTIAGHEFKMVAELETDFQALPLVQCHAGEINQVVLNIVVNAAHAIGDLVAGGGQRGKIRVATGCDAGDVWIRIADSGGGIPDAIRDRIFDPFFTTKGVGRGTGQGLAIARRVIEKHHGSLTFEVEAGQGTTFSIRLPTEQPRAAA